MYLSRFGVKNYKCLAEIDIPLTPIHVLIGENDSGKTSLLEAIAALLGSSEKPLNVAFPAPWDGRELVYQGSPEPRVDLWGAWRNCPHGRKDVLEGHFRYGLVLTFAMAGKSCGCASEWIQVAERQLVQLSKDRGQGVSSVASQGKEPGSVAKKSLDSREKLLEVLKDVLKPTHKYALDAKMIAIPAAIDPQRKFRLDPDGFGLPTLLDDILHFDPRIFIRLTEEFCEFFPQFKSIRLERGRAVGRIYADDGTYDLKRGEGFAIQFETRSGTTIRAQQVSDGVILFLAFLALSHLPDPPGLLLIEEPENGIYPKRLGEIISMLKQMVDRTEGVRFPQIILTTHSPYVLSLFKPEEVTFLSRKKDDPDAPARARPLRDAPHIHERLGDGEFFLGELWYNLSEEELFGEP